MSKGGTEPAAQFMAEESDPEKFDYLEHEAAAKKEVEVVDEPCQ